MLDDIFPSPNLQIQNTNPKDLQYTENTFFLNLSQGAIEIGIVPSAFLCVLSTATINLERGPVFSRQSSR